MTDFMPTRNTRTERDEFHQFYFDASARPKHSGEWRHIGDWDGEGKLVLHPVGSALTDEQIAAMLWSDEFVSYHSTHDPIIQTTSSRMVAFARAVLAATPSRAPAAVQDEPCNRCGGSGVVDDGEMDCSEGGIAYENGPIKCLKDCPTCATRKAAPAGWKQTPYGLAQSMTNLMAEQGPAAVSDLLDIIRDVGQHIDQGRQSEALVASQRPGYGTGVYTHIANQMAKMRALLAAQPAVAPSDLKTGERCAPILAQHNGVKTHDRGTEERSCGTGEEGSSGREATRGDAACTSGVKCGASSWSAEAQREGVTWQASRTVAPSDSAKPAGETVRCPYCDDSGDVHGIDGEWRGRCSCPAGTDGEKPAEEPTLQDALENFDQSEAYRAAVANKARISLLEGMLDAALGMVITDQQRGAIAYQLTKRLVIDMPTARSVVDAAIAAAPTPAPSEHIDWKALYEDMADLYAKALAAPPAEVQAGWKLVPVKPTPEMCAVANVSEGDTIVDGPTFADALYSEMLATAPTPDVATEAGKPVAWSLIFDDDPRLNLSTVFDTEDEAKKYAERCGAATVVPLYLHSSAADGAREKTRGTDNTEAVIDRFYRGETMEKIGAQVTPLLQHAMNTLRETGKYSDNELAAIRSIIAAQPPADGAQESKSLKSVSEEIADALRPFLAPGQKVIWRMPFRWHDDDGVLSNHYDGFSVRGLAEDFGYDVIVDAGEAAIIAALSAGKGEAWQEDAS